MIYYSLLRPIDIGALPRKDFTYYENFEIRTYVDSIGREAWGFVEYSKELTEDEMETYSLMKKED